MDFNNTEPDHFPIHRTGNDQAGLFYLGLLLNLRSSAIESDKPALQGVGFAHSSLDAEQELRCMARVGRSSVSIRQT